MPYAPTLNLRPGWAPVPSIEVVFTTLAAGTQSITVFRLADRRTVQVRGGVRVATPGSVAVVDFEAPNGVPASYRAQMFADLAGTVSLGFTDPTSTTLSFEGACVHQPLDPTRNVAVKVLRGTGDGLVRKTPGSIVYPEGAESGTFIGSTRQGLTGVPFVLITETLDNADKMQSILGGYGESQIGVLCIRVPPPMRIPRTFFAAPGDTFSEQEIDVYRGGQRVQFSFTADEVIPPAPGLVAPLLRRKDIDAAYPTRAARAAAYLTRLDRDRDYTLAGLAG